VTKPLTKKQIFKAFGDNVRRERVSQQVTQEELAERVNLHARSIQKIERGEHDLLLTTVVRIQAGLGCPWDNVLGPAAKRPANPRRR